MEKEIELSDNKRIKFIFDGKHKEGLLVKDNMFWGGYKVVFRNSIMALNIVTLVDEEGNIKKPPHNADK
jgi:hypothetical protein